MSDPRITKLFNPNGVIIVGASHEPSKLGYGLARNLIQGGYRGQVHFVNPRGGQLFERPIYTSITQVPKPADLAILLIPSTAVPESLTACGEHGIQTVIIASGGFREIGPAGAVLEEQCLKIAKKYQIRMLGPNCVGVINTHLPLNATFLAPPGPRPGELSFLSHSGAICQAVIDWANAEDLGFSQIISLGNQADLSESDMLAPVGADPHTRVLTLYLEGFQDGRRFVQQARQVAHQKPLVALKVGRSASGRRAAQSHTGALAGEDHVVNAAFQRAGVLRANTAEELFDWALALAWCPALRGRAVAILTNAGGPGVTAADALEANQLRLADLQATTIQALRNLLPPAASPHNPVDMLASASPETYAACLGVVLEDPGVQGTMVILPPPPTYSATGIVQALIPIIHQSHKPVVVALMGGSQIQEASHLLRSARIPEYRFPERAAAALGALARRAELIVGLANYEQLANQSDTLTKVNLPDARQILRTRGLENSIPTLLPETWLSQEQISQLFKLYGIPTAEIELAHTPEEALEVARKFGLGRGRASVALKIAASELAHKSDAGGVLLNLVDEQAVITGYSQMMTRIKSAYPQAHVQGIFVQAMAPPGQDVIIGAVQDAQFGPVVMFGSGGIEVEGLADVRFSLAPLSKYDAQTMLEQTWAGRKLSGYRNLPKADHQAVIDTMLRVAQMAADLLELAEIEINPLRVLPVGRGALALDIRCRTQAIAHMHP